MTTPADIRIKIRFFDDVGWLEPLAVAAMLDIIKHIACRQVWTYSPPGPPVFPADKTIILRILRLKSRQWSRIKSDVLSFFEPCEGGYRLKPQFDWIEIQNNERPVMSPVLRMAIGRRDNWTCGYCGSTEGPFDIDHVVPISRGGAYSEPENLMCACARCNRSKGAKLVSEWVS